MIFPPASWSSSSWLFISNVAILKVAICPNDFTDSTAAPPNPTTWSFKSDTKLYSFFSSSPWDNKICPKNPTTVSFAIILGTIEATGSHLSPKPVGLNTGWTTFAAWPMYELSASPLFGKYWKNQIINRIPKTIVVAFFM